MFLIMHNLQQLGDFANGRDNAREPAAVGSERSVPDIKWFQHIVYWIPFLVTCQYFFDKEELMKPLLLLLLSTAILSGAAIAPKRGLLGQTASNKETTPPPFSISIKANPDVVTVGQKIFIQIVLTNLSNHPMAAPSAILETLDVVYAFDIRDSTGNKVAQHQLTSGSPIQGVPGTLDPGKDKEEEVILNRFFTLKPGTYEIQVKRCIDLKNPEGEGLPEYDETKGVVWSNKTTLTVLSPVP
jgi:hypothetical protein